MQAAVDKAQLKGLIEAVERARGTRVIVYWTTDTARISEAVSVSLYDQLEAIGHQPAIDLYLRSNGGDVEAPWRIVSLIREYCSLFGVLIPHRAQSGATLLALGADEIVMTPLATLGPIDPTRSHPLLPTTGGAAQSEPVSVQDMRHAMQFVREAAGGGEGFAYTPEAMAAIFAALFDKVHPLAIGAIEQSYALAKLIATKCLSTHMSQDEQSEIKRIADSLCDDFKSHTYLINRAEARSLGLKTVDAPPAVDSAMMDLWKFYSARAILNASRLPPQGGHTKLNVVFLDSAEANFQVVAEYVVEAEGKLRILRDEWLPY